ncbi:aspartate aminotransferase family protein [Asticcacaulis benevestitus]|uniref:Aminotransferase n=1 Tax=Asticcacaulis benevestitus DSM 16100 = ATCC BAA-896 TaxID=1121022 RepID=V4PIX0_9CAUL|nr:aspartate aminotransferase family protein [Asticcacaulis benevestitus]ESQ93907.1 aminotransferase [Asticcacaulis benevestitus DSM 16100 = ATCC BAA-896]
MNAPAKPPVRNYDMNELKKLDMAHHLPAQSDYKLQHELGGSRIITRADGVFITDAEGKSLLDGMAGLWCVNVGYGREELARVAYEQMLELPYYNTFFKTATPPPVKLAAKIAEKMALSNPDLTHVFFNSSGSEANDTIFRLVRYYWELKGEPERTVFISRKNAYHGSTVAGASLGGMTFMHAQGGLPIPGIEHVEQPYHFGEGFGEDEEAFATRVANSIEERILAVGPEKVAAFIGEPVQGAGGVIIPPASYWPKVEAICRKYGILLICDEVICGFGRLGHWFGHQHYGIKPDLIAMAKGMSSGYLPISAVGVSKKIVDVLLEKGGDFVHGYTYSGHPTCAAVSLANIGIMENEGLIERTRDVTGPYLAKALKRLDSHPLVGEARSLGLIGAVEIVSEKGTNKRFKGAEGTAGPIVRDLCIKNGLMVRGIRDSIVMCPPLIITEAEIDQIVDTIEKSLNEAEPVLRAL